MFDVYVNGINPQRIDELEDIKKKVVSALSGEQDLNRLLYPPKGTVCIRKNISEHEAKLACGMLENLGLLCTYKPSNNINWQHLSLVPKEEPEALFTCPACKKQQALKGKPEPKFCPFCEVYIARYLEEEKEKQEYEEVRQKMLLKSRIHLEQEKKDSLREEEKKRKALLEEQIAKEMGLEPKFEWKVLLSTLPDIKKRYWPIPVLLIGTVGWGINQYSAMQDTDDPFAEIPELSEQHTSNQPQDIIGFSNKELPTRNDIIGGQQVRTYNQTPLSKNPSHRFFITQGQTGTIPTTKARSVKDTVPVSNKNRQFLEDIYSELNSDIEWDAYLGKMSRSHIAAGKLKSAYKLSLYQTDLTAHIDVINDLLITFSKLGRNDLMDSTIEKLAQRIAEQPQEQQAFYKAQLAAALQGIGRQNTLFDEAEAIARNLGNAIKQSQASGGIAIYKKKSDQTESANKLFLQAEENLKTASSGFEKFSGYIDLAQNYAKIGFVMNAEIAMTQAENVLSQLDANSQEQGWAMLLNVAYASNKTLLAEKYASHINNTAFRSRAVYYNIQLQLKDKLTSDVSKQLENIPDPEYASVATALSAQLESDTADKGSLTSTAQLKLTSIQDNENKAIATSKVARYFYRLGQEKEAFILFDQAYGYAQTLTDMASKDAALTVLATDFARIFLISRAERTANTIHSKSLKTMALTAIENANAVKDLLAN